MTRVDFASAVAPIAPSDSVADEIHEVHELPDYLRDTYTWAYLTPWTAAFFDRQWVVEFILWGNGRRLIAKAVEQLEPGWRVLQPAAVYGELSASLSDKLGPNGHLDVRDVSKLQIERTRVKLTGHDNVDVDYADAEVAGHDRYDAVCCFFLLHEVPDAAKENIVHAMLEQVGPKGRAVFVDYHQWKRFHPLQPIMRLVFDVLEPFAQGLCDTEVQTLAGEAGKAFDWHKETVFGGLYQVTVANRRA